VAEAVARASALGKLKAAVAQTERLITRALVAADRPMSTAELAISLSTSPGTVLARLTGMAGSHTSGGTLKSGRIGTSSGGARLGPSAPRPQPRGGAIGRSDQLGASGARPPVGVSPGQMPLGKIGPKDW
jgi:hypothetical protein